MKLRLPRLQFSLRTLVIVVVIAAALASWHGSRYARHKARAAALIQFANMNFRLTLAPADAQAPSLLDSWDRYWFGAETAQKYIRAEAWNEEFLIFPEAEVDSCARLLTNFPELEEILIRDYTQFHRFVVMSQRDSNLKKPPPGQVPAKSIPASLLKILPRFRHLKKLVLDKTAGQINDEWIAELPASSRLQQFEVSDIQLTPRGAKELLRKAAGLSQLQLNQPAIDAEVAKLLSTGFEWGAEPTIDYKTAHLIVHVSNEEPSPVLKSLHAPFHLSCRVDQAEHNNALQLTLEDTQVVSLNSRGYATHEIKRCPRLRAIYLNKQNCQSLSISECDALKILRVEYSSQATIRQLPHLEELEILCCPHLEVRDCAQLKKLFIANYSEWREGKLFNESAVTLANLPALQYLYHAGKTLSVEELPNLTIVVAEHPQPHQLEQLSRLPQIERLHLKVQTTRGEQKLPSELESLRDFPRLRLLVYEHESLSLLRNDFFGSDGQGILPPQLDYLLCYGSVLNHEQLQHAYPFLRIVDRRRLGNHFGDFFDYRSNQPPLPLSEFLGRESRWRRH